MSVSRFDCEGAVALGNWLSIGSPVIAELAAECGFDWVLIDLEHGSASEEAVPNQLRALRGTRTQGIVRAGALDPALIGRVLDWGADGIRLPHVRSAEEASSCVAAMRYPPTGSRGVSRTVRAYRYGLGEFPPSKAPALLAQMERGADGGCAGRQAGSAPFFPSQRKPVFILVEQRTDRRQRWLPRRRKIRLSVDHRSVTKTTVRRSAGARIRIFGVQRCSSNPRVIYSVAAFIRGNR